MSAISGIFSLDNLKINKLRKSLKVMNDLQSHRGPDGDGVWIYKNETIGFAHKRLSIIDPITGKQPMIDDNGNVIVFSGEIYNYIELKQMFNTRFNTLSDTEVVLKAYDKWGIDCINRLNGKFSFVIWDENKHSIFCVRDRFGIEPFYYTVVDKTFYFATEMKALLPFIPSIETDYDALNDYFTFQFCLGTKTLFKGIYELSPAHYLYLEKNSKIEEKRYWEVIYNIDFNHTEKYFQERLEEILFDSIRIHTRSDVPIGGYISGGVDSAIVSGIASNIVGNEKYIGFTGKFNYGKTYDESEYARDVALKNGFVLNEYSITSDDFIDNIYDVIYHLDTPVAGTGSFAQYMISKYASKYRKVILGGQGGDEVFGGYTRYLIAYFEQCIKGAIEGGNDNGKFIVTYSSIIPALVSLKNYKPLIKKFWSDGLFDDMDKRYFTLINRGTEVSKVLRDDYVNDYNPYGIFKNIFLKWNTEKGSYFDNMTHFDLKTSLPALLQVEDRVSMAHGITSRVPILDYRLVELASIIPSNFKFKNGDLKHIFKNTFKKYLPNSIVERKDKMGFPVPFVQWINNEAREFVISVFSSIKAKNRDIIDYNKVLNLMQNETNYSRNIWGVFSLELWQENFHDKAIYFKKLLND